ncbi:MAG: GNAT family N-acetyltransferase [Aeromonadaceae bacterium]
MSQPEIETPRLRLRPFLPSDAERVRLLAGDRAIADGCILIPHPYPQGLAERWIATHAAGWQSQSAAIFAITERSGGLLIGSISLLLREERQTDRRIKLIGTLGYWLGRDYWGAGLMSEAVASLLDFAFHELGVDCVEAEHTPSNPASGRVMEKNALRFIEERLTDEFNGQPYRLRRYALEWAEYAARQHPAT